MRRLVMTRRDQTRATAFLARIAHGVCCLEFDVGALLVVTEGRDAAAEGEDLRERGGSDRDRGGRWRRETGRGWI
eukprot:2715309-Rhodomonas_salina.1